MITKNKIRINIYSLLLLCLLLLYSCATTQKGQKQMGFIKTAPNVVTVEYQNLKRSVPNSIKLDIPQNFKEAIQNGTRTVKGKPGPNYWQQKSDYKMDVTVLPDKKKLIGSATITYYNNSPDELRHILFDLIQNIHKKGAARKVPVEVTEAFTINSISINGEPIPENEYYGPWRGGGYFVMGTHMEVVPRNSVRPGEVITMQINWELDLPQSGASGRVGYVDGKEFFIAYWYPKVSVYDDVIGWFKDEFLGRAEFYNEFGHYDVSITVPEEWTVFATGKLTNAEEVFRKPIRKRLDRAYSSDEIIKIVGAGDYGNVTLDVKDDSLTWHFTAKKVNDFAFALDKQSIWEATRSPIGDIDNDGITDYTHINAVYDLVVHSYYDTAKTNWKRAALFTKHAIKFLSQYTGLSYPWPHFTSFEGTGITTGGMEYPMMTLTANYGSPKQLHSTIAHEIAHMWIPMQLATNERRYGWMDEGFTTFHENQIENDFYTDGINFNKEDIKSYINAARNQGYYKEAPIMRFSDYFKSYRAFTTASYQKPATILVVLQNMLGDELFRKCYLTFMKRWQFKHPYPWDLFNTFEDISGRNLDWFWRSWFYETWVLDRGVAKVEPTANGTRIVIKDYGQIPMPAHIKITLGNGNILMRKIDVGTWLQGATKVTLLVHSKSDVVKVVIGPQHRYPDIRRDNNVWKI